jgi:ribosomal-protein-alanine acetyltransferase
MQNHQDPPSAEPDGATARPVIYVPRSSDLSSIQSLFQAAGLTPVGNCEKPSGDHAPEFLVCEDHGERIAAIHWRSVPPEAEILDIAVKQDHRHRGFATALIQEFLRRARTQCIERIFLEVRESNAPALALYGNFGFQITGRRPRYYRNPDEDALLLQLLVGAHSG